MASNKRKQDEKHLKLLREIVALPHNKQCFDCHQRGPTYINMTIGCFVCTACSGLLRGLNPPNRVKSISMASFTPEEMDFIKCHGNDFCRKVWLGLYDNRLGNQSESREESKVKDFMIQKYERKRYYVAPTENMKGEAERMNESVSKAPGTKPLKSLLGENAPRLQVATNQEEGVVETVEEDFFSKTASNEVFEQTAQVTGLTKTSSEDFFPQSPQENTFTITENPFPQSVQEDFFTHTAVETSVPQTIQEDFFASPVTEEPKAPVAATPPPIVHNPSSTPHSPSNVSLQSSKSSGSTAMDLLGDLGNDPFASSAPHTHSGGGGGFADFGNFGATTSTQQPAFAQSTPLQPAGSSVAAPQQQAFNGFGSTPAPSAGAPPGPGGDKYSNLTDLFSISDPEVAETSPATGWSSTLSSGSGGSGWNNTSTQATASGGINWGGESNSSTSQVGVNWNTSSATQPPLSAAGGMSWGGGGGIPASMPASSWGTPATAQSNGLGAPGNPFLQPNVSNPFGGGSNTSLTSKSTMAGVPQPQMANPFGGQPAQQPGGFGAFGSQNTSAPQSGGFGQFGGAPQAQNPAVSAGSGFGQFGTPGTQNPAVSSAAGFGQYGVQNGVAHAGFGQQGFGGQQQQQQQQQQHPGFGQQGGFGGQPAQGFGQPGQGFTQPAQGFGQPAQVYGGQPQQQMQGFGAQPGQPAPGWGQMPASTYAANPFMSTAQQYSAAPKTGASNPFL